MAGKVKLTERQMAHRNLNPHAEARLAMALWSEEYAFKQRGGSMDFWDKLTPGRQRLCVDIVTSVLNAEKSAGRAYLASSGKDD